MRLSLQPREGVEPGDPWWKGYTEYEFREILELARRWERLEKNVKKAAQYAATPPKDTAMRSAQQDLLFVVQPAMQAHEKPGSPNEHFAAYLELRSRSEQG